MAFCPESTRRIHCVTLCHVRTSMLTRSSYCRLAASAYDICWYRTRRHLCTDLVVTTVPVSRCSSWTACSDHSCQAPSSDSSEVLKQGTCSCLGPMKASCGMRAGRNGTSTPSDGALPCRCMATEVCGTVTPDRCSAFA
eukprot:345130-Amphidinium_carterae.1